MKVSFNKWWIKYIYYEIKGLVILLYVFEVKNKSIPLFLVIVKYYIHLQGEFKTLRFINFQINNTKHFSSYIGSIYKINIPIIQSLSLRHERENSE